MCIEEQDAVIEKIAHPEAVAHRVVRNAIGKRQTAAVWRWLASGVHRHGLRVGLAENGQRRGAEHAGADIIDQHSVVGGVAEENPIVGEVERYWPAGETVHARRWVGGTERAHSARSSERGHQHPNEEMAFQVDDFQPCAV